MSKKQEAKMKTLKTASMTLRDTNATPAAKSLAASVLSMHKTLTSRSSQ